MTPRDGGGSGPSPLLRVRVVIPVAEDRSAAGILLYLAECSHRAHYTGPLCRRGSHAAPCLRPALYGDATYRLTLTV